VFVRVREDRTERGSSRGQGVRLGQFIVGDSDTRPAGMGGRRMAPAHVTRCRGRGGLI
jgi:hypothetical protein